jgi:hypothetical protein
MAAEKIQLTETANSTETGKVVSLAATKAQNNIRYCGRRTINASQAPSPARNNSSFSADAIAVLEGPQQELGRYAL